MGKEKALDLGREQSKKILDINAAMQLRICEPTNIVGTIEEIIKILVDENVIHPKLQARKLPFAKFETSISTNEKIHFNLKEHRNLFGIVKHLCTEHNLNLTNEQDTIVLTV